MKATREERCWAKVDRTGDCWLWTAAIGTHGYGVFKPSYREPTALAHRYSYALVVGPVSLDLQLDHLCRNRPCVNPDHLEPVTQQVNIARQVHTNGFAGATHCVHGHPFSVENTYVRPKGGRACRTCRLDRQRRYQKERRETRVA